MTSPPRLPVPMLVFVGLLVVWEPLTFALTASAALPRLVQFGGPALLLLGYRAVVAGLGIAVGRALRALESSAPQVARTWLVLHIVALMLTFMTPYFPSSRAPSTKQITLALLVAADVAWWAWLTWSPTVARIYDQQA